MNHFSFELHCQIEKSTTQNLTQSLFGISVLLKCVSAWKCLCATKQSLALICASLWHADCCYF